MSRKIRDVIHLSETEGRAEVNTIGSENITLFDGVPCISGFYEPLLNVFRPRGPANGVSIIICPGGGYEKLAIEHEGNEVAESLSQWGYTVFVLKYRLPDGRFAPDELPLPLVDMKAAYAIVQKCAIEWGLNPASIGLMGFSAGGHLASLSTSLFSLATSQNSAQDLISPRFTILIYPVISFTDEITHLGSRSRFLGPDPHVEDIKRYSSEFQVTQYSPPAFVVHCTDDTVVSVENSLLYYRACLKNDVPAEIHIYPEGGHGFGMNNAFSGDCWMDRLQTWLLQFY